MRAKRILVGGIVAGVLLLAALGALGARLWVVESDRTAERAVYLSEVATLTQERTQLQERVEALTLEQESLVAALRKAQNANDAFEERISDIASTVGVLEKVATTDPELLMKYSRVYFLNEHYSPPELSPIDEAYVYPVGKELSIHAEVAPYLEDLLSDAAEDAIDLRVISAFRSFGTQGALKGAYTVSYGSGANRFSADQGYSEHQLGTTVDFTTPEVAGTFSGFSQTEAYAWLQNHAHRYGFILSYPQGNAYYQFEPWHWRFVGRDLARYLHNEGMDFYDVDQRTLDEYIPELFD